MLSEKRYGNLFKWMVPMVVCIILCWPLLIQGGSLDPTAPPESTMKSLDEIYSAIEEVQFSIDNMNNQVTIDAQALTDKEGFTQHFTYSNYDNVPKFYPIVTVPAGKRLVIVQILMKGFSADLEVWQSDSYHHTLLDSDVLTYSEEKVGRYVFPEPCVSLSGDDQLYLKLFPKQIPEPPFQKSTLEFTLIGYYLTTTP